jgi:hypothetical protein
MIITFARSSSLNNYENYCQTSSFITYNLGYLQDPNVKTMVGSATHLVLECIAMCKKFIQENPLAEKIVVNNPTLGEISTTVEEMYSVEKLSIRAISEINKSRSNKLTYLHNVQLPEISSRMGEAFVQDLVKRSCYYYAEKSVTEWEAVNYIDARNFTWMALECDDGRYDPRNRTVIEPEQEFSFIFKEDWAKYCYEVAGEKIEGYFGIKGTIDLITKYSDTEIEIIDWKTGQRKDWGTGKVKDYEYLQNDTQLMLYYYAARKLYPDIKDIFFTIFFIRHGGPYTISFDDSHMEKMKEHLKKHFNDVRNNVMPTMVHPMQNDFKCYKLCDYYKKKWPGSTRNMCKFIQDELQEIGMEKVLELHKKPGFSFSTYSQPGT